MAESDVLSCEFCGSPSSHAESRDWHMPLTLDADLMRRMGDALWAQLPAGVGVHLVVVASGGFGVGVAAALTATASMLRSVTVVKRAFDFVSPEVAPAPGEAVVIVDNSLHTGRSVARVIEHLHARSIAVTAVVTVFDGANECESQARRDLAASTGVPVLACARWTDRYDWA